MHHVNKCIDYLNFKRYFLLNCDKLLKYYMSQLSENVFVFHVDLVSLELFQSTQRTFWGIACICQSSDHAGLISSEWINSSVQLKRS